MKAVSLDSSSGYDQPQRMKKWMCKKGCSKGRAGEGGRGVEEREGGGGEQTLLGLLLHIKPKRKQSSHLTIKKKSPSPGVSPCHLCVPFLYISPRGNKVLILQ